MEALVDLNFSTAVFVSSDQKLILVHLEDDEAERATSDVASRGYVYAGSIAVIAGEVKVATEPGFETSIVFAAWLFAQMIGPTLKEHQLKLERQAEANQRPSREKETA